jgi:hypothetical protein
MDDDHIFADLFAATDSDSDPTARGIVQCLRMLAEEAASLSMGRTLAALEAAIRVCADESDSDDDLIDETMCGGPPLGAAVH